MKQRLRFYARGTALVADVHAQEHPTHPIRRFVGRRWQEVMPGRFAWCPTEAPQELDYHHDLARACRDGDLWPADEETAKAVGVAFDPTFGGEETETIRKWRERAGIAQPAAAAKKSDAKTEAKTEAPKGSAGKGEG
jgi:hypothetical protein